MLYRDKTGGLAVFTSEEQHQTLRVGKEGMFLDGSIAFINKQLAEDAVMLCCLKKCNSININIKLKWTSQLSNQCFMF